jgi:hypothetical protein
MGREVVGNHVNLFAARLVDGPEFSKGRARKARTKSGL